MRDDDEARQKDSQPEDGQTNKEHFQGRLITELDHVMTRGHKDAAHDVVAAEDGGGLLVHRNIPRIACSVVEQQDRRRFGIGFQDQILGLILGRLDGARIGVRVGGLLGHRSVLGHQDRFGRIEGRGTKQLQRSGVVDDLPVGVELGSREGGGEFIQHHRAVAVGLDGHVAGVFRLRDAGFGHQVHAHDGAEAVGRFSIQVQRPFPFRAGQEVTGVGQAPQARRGRKVLAGGEVEMAQVIAVQGGHARGLVNFQGLDVVESSNRPPARSGN